MSYLCRLYFSQLHIVIQNSYSSDSLASQTSTLELVIHDYRVCSAGPKASHSMGQENFFLWVIRSSG